MQTSLKRRKEEKIMSSTYKKPRSAVNGQFVTWEEAKKHPKTTVVETMKKK